VVEIFNPGASLFQLAYRNVSFLKLSRECKGHTNYSTVKIIKLFDNISFIGMKVTSSITVED